jgi:hypothetical protein
MAKKRTAKPKVPQRVRKKPAKPNDEFIVLPEKKVGMSVEERIALKTDMDVIRRSMLSEFGEAVRALYLPREQGIEMLNDPDSSLLVAILAKAVARDNWKVINAFVERVMGKTMQTIDIRANITTQRLSDKQKIKMANEYLKMVKGTL